MKEKSIYMEIHSGKVRVHSQQKIMNLLYGDEIIFPRAQNVFVDQGKEKAPICIQNSCKIAYRGDYIQIYEWLKTNPWLLSKDGQIVQKATYGGDNIPYLEETYGIGKNQQATLKRYKDRFH